MFTKHNFILIHELLDNFFRKMIFFKSRPGPQLLKIKIRKISLRPDEERNIITQGEYCIKNSKVIFFTNINFIPINEAFNF